MHSELERLAALGADPEETELVEAIVDSIDRYASDHFDDARVDAEGEIPRSVLAAADRYLSELTPPDR